MAITADNLHFTRSDILAVLTPGAFVLGSTILVFAIIWHAGDVASAWRWSESSNLWIVVLLLAMGAYLTGSMIRAMSVSVADNLSALVFRRFVTSRYNQTLYSDTFPYLSILQSILNELKNNELPEDAKLPLPHTSHTMYKLWKIQLSEAAPNAFAYTQELEYRTRLFAGMFWAGTWGVIVTTIGILWCLLAFRHAESQWWIPLTIQLFVSTLFSIVFGWTLRRVRGQEVAYVFLATHCVPKRP